jgi:TatD DNase family protein
MKFDLIDTHCHIHSSEYGFDVDGVIERAEAEGVSKLVLIATSPEDYQDAKRVKDASGTGKCYLVSGIHPHDAARWSEVSQRVADIIKSGELAGVGEIGLDYHYEKFDKGQQELALREQLKLGLEQGLPFSFHVRDSFEDFFRIVDEYVSAGSNIQGVVHCFTGTFAEAEGALSRGLFLGIGGIMTFSKDLEHAKVVREIPLVNFVLETDSPYLTPNPLRGTINEPKNVRLIAQFIADARGIELEEVATATTQNAHKLFNL